MKKILLLLAILPFLTHAEPEKEKKKPWGFTHLRVSVVGKPGKGKKSIKVDAATWEKAATVTITHNISTRPIVFTLAEFAKDSQTHTVGNSYQVVMVDESGKTLSKQSNTNKGGGL